MNFSNLRSLKAPLQTYEESNLLSIYLTAWLIIIIKMAFLIGGTIGISAISSALNSTLATSHNIDSQINYLLVILKFIIILTFFAFTALQLGYITETVKFEVKNVKYIMPIWEDNYLHFFCHGILVLIIMFSYIIPLIIIANLVGFAQAREFNLFLLLDITAHDHPVYLLVALGVVFIWLISIAITLYADTNDFFQAYNIRTIWNKTFDHFPYYIAAFVFSLLYLIIFAFVSFLLSFTCVGFLFVPILIEFILPIIILNMFAQVYKLQADEN